MKKTLGTLYFISLPLMGIAFLAGFLNLFWGITIAYVGAVLLFVSNPSIKKKALFLLGVLFIPSSLILGWPFGYILPMKGNVKDKKTGAPISNAVFEIQWLYNYVHMAGGHRSEFVRTYVVSGKDGEYRIPGRIMLPIPICTYGISQIITLRYPLYKSKDCDMGEHPLVFTDEDRWKERGAHYIWRKPHFRPRFGRIKRDFELVREINMREIDAYYDQAMDLRVAKNIDWDGIFKECFATIDGWPARDKENAIKYLTRTQARVSGVIPEKIQPVIGAGY